MTIGAIIFSLVAVFRIVAIKNREANLKFLFEMVLLSGVFENIGYCFKVIESCTYYRYAMIIYILYYSVTYIADKQGNNELIIKKSRLTAVLLFIVCVLCGWTNIYFNSSQALVALPNMSFDAISLGRLDAVQPVLGKYTIINGFWLMVFIIFVLQSSYLLRNKEAVQDIAEALIKGFCLLFVFTIVEFIIANTVSPKVSRGIVNTIVGVTYNNSTYVNGIRRYGYYAAYGLYSEPSYMSSIIVYYLLMFYRGFRRKREYIFYVMSAICLVISGSTMCFSLLAFWLIIPFYHSVYKYMNYKEKRVVCISILLLILLAVMFLFLYQPQLKSHDSVLDKIYDYIRGTKSNNSGYLRREANNRCYNVLRFNPLFGVGVGTTRGTGFIPGMLSNIGILGSISLLNFYHVYFNISVRNKKIMMIILCAYLTSIFSTWYMYSPFIIALLLCFNINYESLQEMDVRKKDIYEKKDI